MPAPKDVHDFLTDSHPGLARRQCVRHLPTRAGPGGAAAVRAWRPPGRPRGLLEGAGTQTRFIRVWERDDRLAAAIGWYVHAAVAERLFRR
jgi:hypothetical protein